MPIENRAKQFMPFSALKGLYDALEQKERIVVEKIELTDDLADILELNLSMLRCGQIATVVYYNEYEYVKKTGMVSKIDEKKRFMRIVDEDICLDDIIDIEPQ